MCHVYKRHATVLAAFERCLVHAYHVLDIPCALEVSTYVQPTVHRCPVVQQYVT